MVIDQGRWFIYTSAVSTISSAHLRIWNPNFGTPDIREYAKPRAVTTTIFFPSGVSEFASPRSPFLTSNDGFPENPKAYIGKTRSSYIKLKRIISKEQVQCSRCQSKKIRCNRADPRCDKCEATGAECIYPSRKPRATRRA